MLACLLRACFVFLCFCVCLCVCVCARLSLSLWIEYVCCLDPYPLSSPAPPAPPLIIIIFFFSWLCGAVQTGTEASVDRLMKQISSFMHEITDEFKIVVVEAIRALCLKFPQKYPVLMNFLSNTLRDEVCQTMPGFLLFKLLLLLFKLLLLLLLVCFSSALLFCFFLTPHFGTEPPAPLLSPRPFIFLLWCRVCCALGRTGRLRVQAGDCQDHHQHCRECEGGQGDWPCAAVRIH